MSYKVTLSGGKMAKSLYQLKPGDFWVERKGSGTRTFSFVKEVTDEGNYIVELEFLVHDGKRIVAYKFEGDQRKYNPETWFANPTTYDLHSANDEEYTELVKMLFELDLDIENWTNPISDPIPSWKKK